MIRHALVAGVLIVSAIGAPAHASDCSDARERYNSAVSEISYTLRRYTNCVNNSAGADDCYTEFRRLKNAQDDFEAAVSEIGSYCRY
jgi:hypothetical protein